MRRHLFEIKHKKYPKPPTSFEEITEIFKHDEVKKQFSMSKYDNKEKFYLDTILSFRRIHLHIYVLLSSKSQEAYIHLMKYLKSNVLDFKPNSIITDFETSLRNALKCVYPNVKLIGCWFHYTNAIRRKASRIPKFLRKLNRNKNAKALFSKFLFLPLLKPNNIVVAYHILQEETMGENYFTENTNESFFSPFIKYFNNQWIKKVSELKFL